MNRLFKISLLLALIALGLLGWRYGALSRELAAAQAAANSEQINQQTVDFALIFINRVLRAESEVDFETRLDLENRVRALKNPSILASWQRFIASQSESEAQENVKNLLEVLVKNLQTHSS
jgi:hypothetical protein